VVKRATEADDRGNGQDPLTASVPPPELLAAPGFLARRLYQAYLAAWARNVDQTLTGPQFAVLTAVARYPRADQGSLAAAVALDRSTMADVVRRLEERGLVRRETDVSDGRRKLVSLTLAGSEAYNNAYRKARELDEMLLAGRTPVERQALMADLTELVERWERIAPLS
jgi:DNA-binding MarR family transcriptional regulator